MKVYPKVLAAAALPLGTSKAFQDAVVAVERALQDGKFDEAKALIPTLPHRNVKLFWDETTLAPSLQSGFAKCREEAIASWNSSLGVQFVRVLKPEEADLTVSFQPSLQAPTNSKALPGLAEFFSAPGQPWKIDCVIGLKRGANGRATNDADVYNDFAYAIGHFFGLTESKMPVGVMYRPEDGLIVKSQVVPQEHTNAKDVFALVTALEEDADHKQMMAAGRGKAFVDPVSFSVTTPAVQGAEQDFAVQITNTGDAALTTRLFPGCSCFAVSDPITIPPGETRLYQVQMQTIDYTVDVTKHLFLSTGDADLPSIDIPVSVRIKPRYRFIYPKGQTMLVGENGADSTFYMVEDGPEIFVESMQLTGLKGDVTFDTWSGVLADPVRNEPARKRTGYKIHVHLDKAVPSGRFFVSLYINTSDTDFRRIITQLFAQRGIVAIPDSIFLGHVSAVPREIDTTIIRPGKPFSILSITSDDKHLKVRESGTAKAKLDSHNLHMSFDGDVISGDYNAVITVKTDDPTQPTIKIPFSATVQ